MPDPPRVRFDAFEFDERSGELWYGEGDDRELRRLSPQPARLLSHLIERRPHLVEREEIRELLWPDAEVELEQSVHTCVRQIRAALGDTASSPRFVETIPRRGYRFLGAVDGDPSRGRRGPSASRRSRRAALAAGIGLALLLIAAGLRFGAGPAAPPVRIAVMPFEPIDKTSVLVPGNDLAESLMDLLVELHGSSAEIVGPTTTERYADPPRLRELIEELDVDYLVNGRETRGDTGPRLLVEIIRGRDGAHVWVEYLDQLPSGSEPAETIARAVVETVP